MEIPWATAPKIFRPPGQPRVDVYKRQDFVEVFEVLFQDVAHPIKVAQRVHCPERRAFLARAVVGDQRDNRVLKKSLLRKELHHPAHLGVGMFEHAREGGLEAHRQSLLVV